MFDRTFIKKVLFLMFAVATAMTLAWALGGCAKAPNSTETSLDFADDLASGIVHGHRSPKKNEVAQSVVALVSVSEQGQALCTGSLIAKDTVLTAAHCVEGNPNRLIVAFGQDLKKIALEDRREVDAYVQHPRWQQPSSEGRGDLALVHFKGKLPKDFHPIRLVTKATTLEVGTESLMMGYGVSNGRTERGSGVLRETETQILKKLTPTEIVSDGRKTSVCFGDSGGPALVKGKKGYEQWGIASSVTNRACNEASVHTSILPYKAWIKEKTSQLRAGVR